MEDSLGISRVQIRHAATRVRPVEGRRDEHEIEAAILEMFSKRVRVTRRGADGRLEYLVVWEREVTAAEDPELREPALPEQDKDDS